MIIVTGVWEFIIWYDWMINLEVLFREMCYCQSCSSSTSYCPTAGHSSHLIPTEKDWEPLLLNAFNWRHIRDYINGQWVVCFLGYWIFLNIYIVIIVKLFGVKDLIFKLFTIINIIVNFYTYLNLLGSLV